jgi:hypothetical protein
MRYRKKPVVIDAWQFDPYAPAPDWINLVWFHEEIETDSKGRKRRGAPIIIIPTLEGKMTARIGDWIIRGTKGEVYPCKPDIFAQCYEADRPETSGGEKS